LPDPETVFNELRRVARPDCLFAFSVPNSFWLMLTLPDKYLGKCSAFNDILMKNRDADNNPNHKPAADHTMRMSRKEGLQKNTDVKSGWTGKLLPKGHGVYTNFGECYRAFRIPAWNNSLISHGFVIDRIVSLLLYGPSVLPIIPTTQRLIGYDICSSVLFLITAQK
jgi:hypothetical protein